MTPALIDRLRLTEERFQSMANGLKSIADLPDPVGVVLKKWTVPSGLNISCVSVPSGVIAVIYESRPNVTADAAALCLKSGNSVILRGGSECAATNRAITDCLQTGLSASNLPPTAIQYVPQQSRKAVAMLLLPTTKQQHNNS